MTPDPRKPPQMAQAAPPHAELHPMRVLFVIPKDPPPRLDGAFSAAFKGFVEACLQARGDWACVGAPGRLGAGERRVQ